VLAYSMSDTVRLGVLFRDGHVIDFVSQEGPKRGEPVGVGGGGKP
jgi:hypothetical protein